MDYAFWNDQHAQLEQSVAMQRRFLKREVAQGLTKQADSTALLIKQAEEAIAFSKARMADYEKARQLEISCGWLHMLCSLRKRSGKHDLCSQTWEEHLSVVSQPK